MWWGKVMPLLPPVNKSKARQGIPWEAFGTDNHAPNPGPIEWDKSMPKQETHAWLIRGTFPPPLGEDVSLLFAFLQ